MDDRAPPWMRALAWVLFAASLIGLTLCPLWLPAGTSVRLVVVAGAQAKIRAWVEAMPEVRSSPGAKLENVTVDEGGIRLDFGGKVRPGTALILSPIEAGSRGTATGSSLAFREIAPDERDRPLLHQLALNLAASEDGSLVQEQQKITTRVGLPHALLGLGLALWALWLWRRDRWAAPSAEGTFLKRTHLLPVALQLTFFAYWSLYWPPVAQHAPSIVAQFLFGYGLDVLLAWSQRRPWPGLAAVGAPVLSANLFVWFTGQSHWVSYLIVALAIGSKATLRRQGVHIFNPSAFATSIAALLTIAFHPTISHSDIASAISSPPSMSELMFLLTLIPLSLLRTAFVPLGAALALGLLSKLAQGPTFTWPGWFLAVTIFAGDPATVPKTRPGRFLFGLLVGAGIHASALLLMRLTGTDFWAKVLPIPLANLAVPWIDRAGLAALGALSRRFSSLSALAPRADLGALALWVLLFWRTFSGSKAGGFPAEFHRSWGTPLVQIDRTGAASCRDNPAFCRPFRLDLEVAGWLAHAGPRAHGAPAHSARTNAPDRAQ